MFDLYPGLWSWATFRRPCGTASGSPRVLMRRLKVLTHLGGQTASGWADSARLQKPANQVSSRPLDEALGQERSDDQQQIRNPGIENDQAALLQKMRIVQHRPEIKVQQIQAVTSL